jgi:AcrR family transcriptional regulator
MAATSGDHDAVRDHILEAAHRVIAEHGLAAASTRAIAEEAGIGAGTLYNYFEDRLKLLAHSIFRRAHIAFGPLADLPSRAGTGSIAGNLRFFARRLTGVLDELVPLFSAAFSDIELMGALRREMASSPAHRGPFAGNAVERYLLAERALGRVSPDVDCAAAAALVAALCHDRAFHRFFRGDVGRTTPPAGEIDLIARALTTPRPS